MRDSDAAANVRLSAVIRKLWGWLMCQSESVVIDLADRNGLWRTYRAWVRLPPTPACLPSLALFLRLSRASHDRIWLGQTEKHAAQGGNDFGELDAHSRFRTNSVAISEDAISEDECAPPLTKSTQ